MKNTLKRSLALLLVLLFAIPTFAFAEDLGVEAVSVEDIALVEDVATDDVVVEQAEEPVEEDNLDLAEENVVIGDEVAEEIAEANDAFTVTFKGEGISTYTVTAADTGAGVGVVTEPTAPVRDGYTFDGWLDGNTLVTFPYTVHSNTELVAKWTGKPIEVEYQYYDGTEWKALTTKGSVAYGSLISDKPTVNNVSGKQLEGWYKTTAANAADKWFFQGEDVPAGKKTDDYKVTTANLPDGAFTWYAADGVTSANIATGAKGKITLYAKLSSVYYVKYVDHADNDKQVGSTITAYAGAKLTPPDAPAHTGMTFEGWTSSASTYDKDKNIITFGEYSENTLTVTANYSDTQHTVTYVLDSNFTGFDPTGVAPSPDTTTNLVLRVPFGEKVVKPTYKLADAAHDVYAWKDVNGTPFTFGQEIDKNITLYPQVLPCFKVTFVTTATEAAQTAGTPYTPYGDVVTVFPEIKNTVDAPATNPTAANGRFLGWYKATVAEGKYTLASDKYDFTTAVAENITIAAKFNFDSTIKTNVVNIYYSLNRTTGVVDGSTASETQYIETNNKATAPVLQDIEGYRFVRWFNTDDNSTFDFATNTITGATNIMAEYQKLVYTVSFTVNGGTAVTTRTGVNHNAVLYGKDANSVPAGETKIETTRSNFVFGGWYKDQALTQRFWMVGDTKNGVAVDADTASKVTENLTLYADWKGAQQKVTFKIATGDTSKGTFKDATSPVEVKVPYNTTINDAVTNKTIDGAVPTVVPATGFSFVGWTYVDASDNNAVKDWDLAQSKVTGTTELTAKFASETFVVKFDTDGGSAVAEQYIVKGGSVDVLKFTNDTAKHVDNTPTKKGYMLTGWYLNKAFEGDKYFVGDGATASFQPTENVTFYAKWVDASYTISYEAKGPTSAALTDAYKSTLTTRVSYGETLTKPEVDPANIAASKLVFDGWYSDASCETPYVFGSAIEKNLTLYAKFAAAYKITFHTKATYAANSIYDGTPIIKLVKAMNGITAAGTEPDTTNLNLVGAIFDGWYDLDPYGPAKDTAKVFDFNTVLTDDIDVYAKYAVKDTKAVTFYFNSGTDGSAATSLTQNVEVGKSAVAPTITRAGYALKDWKPSNGSAITDTVPFSFAKVFTADDPAETKLMADWSQETYTVTFESNEGTKVNPISVSYTGNVAPKLTVPTDPTKTGYEFAGWYTDKATTEAFIFSNGLNKQGTSGTGTPTQVTKNMTVYAKWTAINYVVTLHTFAGAISGMTAASGAAASNNLTYTINVPYNKTVGEIKKPAVADGKQAFAGWYTNAGLTTAFDATTPITGNKDLYAKYMNAVEVVVSATGWVYDGTAHAANVTASATAKYATDVIPAVVVEYKKKGEADTAYTTTAPVNADSYIVRASVAQGTNTAPAEATTELVISQKEVTVKWDTKTEFTYNGAEQAPAVTFEGTVNGESANATVKGATAVGSHTATLTMATDGNYKLAAGQKTTCAFTIVANTTAPTVEATVNEDSTVTIVTKDASGKVLTTEKVEIGKDASNADFDIKTTQNPDGTVTVTMTAKAGSGYQLSAPIVVTGKVTLPTATKITALKPGKKKMTVSWDVVTDADGYEIQYGLKKGAAGKMTPKKFTGAATAKATIKKLKKGKRYYFRIRTYKTVNGTTVYSDWSAWKRASKKQKIK